MDYDKQKEARYQCITRIKYIQESCEVPNEPPVVWIESKTRLPRNGVHDVAKLLSNEEIQNYWSIPQVQNWNQISTTSTNLFLIPFLQAALWLLFRSVLLPSFHRMLPIN